ncbi:MAG: secretin N-terminal domain-containing protein [Geobacteraceae bacterium]
MQRMTNIFLLFTMLAFLNGCSSGRSAFGKAQKMELDGSLDEAVVKYAAAAAANPDIGEYRLRLLQASEKAAKIHFSKGDQFLESKKYDDALREYQAAFALDPSLKRAAQQSELVIKLRTSLLYFQEGAEFEKNRKPKEALHSYQKAVELNPDNQEAGEAVERLLKSRRTKLGGYELHLKSTKPITLKFKDAKIKELFNIVSQLSGINFVFDEGVKDQNFSIYLENATFQQALDIITGLNKLGKKALNENTIIIYPKTPEKNKQYDDLFVQTFYLNKLDAKKAVNLIRTMLQVKKIYVNEEMNALVIRDTPEVIEVARKILDANDVPDAEVVLEVEVIELSKKNAENFGLTLSRYAVSTNVLTPGGQFFADTFTPTQTSVAAGSPTPTPVAPSNLLNYFNWNGFGGFVTVPNATFNLGKTLANGETLSNPKIRVKNREKAKFNVGTRVPITTANTTNQTVSVNVQYVDVGVKLNAEPTIQLSNDVSIKLSLEVSSILSRETVGGADSSTTVVTIGTRNLDTVLNLKDGETSIIGGLIQDNKNNSKKKVYLLGDIPIIGALFSGHENSADKTELLLAITPRIVRGITMPESDVAAFWSGKEDEPSTARLYSSFLQEPELLQTPAADAVAPSVAPPPATTQLPVTPTISAPAPSVASGAELQQTIPVPPGTIPTVETAAPQSAPQPLPVPTLLRILAPASVKVNEQFTVEAVAADVVNLYSAQFVLVYDQNFVEPVGVAEGGFMRNDGKPAQFRSSIDKNSGQIKVELIGTGGVGGMNGRGSLITATFRAKNQGPANFGFTGVSFTDPGGKALQTIPFNSIVEIK